MTFVNFEKLKIQAQSKSATYSNLYCLKSSDSLKN